MSGIIGLFSLNGRPIDRSLPARMLAAVRHRGPDDARVWQDGPVALGHCLLETTPESAGEVQPHHLVHEGLCITFDGRIDNREDLLEHFDRARFAPGDDSDAAFALCAYRCWGEDCGARLLGDFAFAIWDARRRQLFCVRDVLGIKPFYYHRGPNVFLFASEPQALLAHPAVSRRPNEGMVGEYLSVITSVEDTLFADIQRLPRASRLVVSADRCRIDTYWDIDATREIRYKTTAEYGEHLRAVLREAVRARLRSGSRVGVMLSGGVDSSSVLAMAASLRAAGEVPAACDAWSMVAIGGVEDETPFIDQVVARNGCCSHKVPGEVWALSQYRSAARSRGDVPPTPTGRLASSLKRRAQESGVRVLLTGLWGDEWFSGSQDYSADLFLGLKWAALARRVRCESRFQEPGGFGLLLKTLAWRPLPRMVRKRVKMAIGRDCIPPWVRPDFASRIALADRLYPVDREPAFPTLAQATIHRETQSGLITLGMEEEDRTAAEFGVETRHPFADRRVMEFGMAIPEDLRRHDGVRKFVLREAMREYLPDAVGRRMTSPDASSVFMTPLNEVATDGLLHAPAIEHAGWTDGAVARRLYDSMALRYANGDDTYGRDARPLWMIAALEMWMRDVVTLRSAEEDVCEEMTISA